MEIEYTEDGYPTEEFLEWLRTEKNLKKAAKWLFEEFPNMPLPYAFMEVNMIWDDLRDREVPELSFSTGGWSGNESIIDAMNSNFAFSIHHASWKQGGHYTYKPVFKYNEDEK